MVTSYRIYLLIPRTDTEYMDRLELKSTSDRTFGLGVVEGESEILVLTAATLMRALIDEDAVANFDPEHGRANLIKSTMTQAILYGSHAEVRQEFNFMDISSADMDTLVEPSLL